MKTNGMGKKILIFALIAAIVLTMQGPRVFAESLQPESQSETSAGQPENQPETTGDECVSQNDLPEEEQENRPETTEDESVSQNDLPEEEQENQPETTEDESVSGNDLSELQSENQPVVAAEQTYPELTDDILKDCKVTGMNPPGVTVNLFDYWQSGGPSPYMEISHDQTWFTENGEPIISFSTYNMGISEGHLLRFGYKCVGCDECKDFGAWNDSITGKQYSGIVKNSLGAFGFPVLNLDTKSDDEFGGYAKLDGDEKEKYLSPYKKEESLSYLFSSDDRSASAHEYRAMYLGVEGLFQPDEDGYYYYNSAENFASYDQAAKSFILYNSPGVANEISRGQFFPFNTAKEVFDTYTFDNGKYHLCYVDKNNDSKGDPESYDYPISIDGNSYLKCTADRLNHYLGMTLEFLFEQPENGCMPNGKEMTFEFTGDDDVWIFIDKVLVADLGGIHGSCSFTINFATGEVNVEGEKHTLLDSFLKAYEEDPSLERKAFRDNIPTFADNTKHSLKMFYLERGHTASDLDLKFNVLPMPDEPGKEDPPQDPDEPGKEDPPQDPDDPGKDDPPQNPDEPGKEDPPQDPDDPGGDPPPNGNTDEYKEFAPDIISVNDNRMVLDITGIPQTGDNSLIEWLSALCIISLLGIGAAVYNLIFVRRKQKNHSSKQ